ncbi:DUF1318 domain-containing protein [Coraliomargarita sp. SDUM461004]|uniref:DUF1318 domain-containing protein n=1 Tax=Thalassobacterium sedimentorum TaxID=3041258 RepID=A0ABU1AHG9_9BACT|nr:DUF1318 domain-containing protein [Coraliomargarita sp. SDUM461004]MDQ8194267.1 DUF1318 domain-containing protein [Coraliomargarita sp. SDUM461004]
MKNYILLFKCVFICCLGFFYAQAPLSAQASGTTEEALRHSIGERLPALMELKLQALVGETNMGLVEARADLDRSGRRLLADENRDRLAYYKLISERLGIPVAAVQRKRAEQIRKNLPQGVWFQSQSGEWFRQ